MFNVILQSLRDIKPYRILIVAAFLAVDIILVILICHYVVRSKEDRMVVGTEFESVVDDYRSDEVRISDDDEVVDLDQ